MALTDFAKEYLGRMFPDGYDGIERSDPEFFERFANFAFDEVINMPLQEGQERMDDRTRFMAFLSVLLGCQGLEQFRILLPASLNMGLTPVEVREIVYQAVAYLGLGRVRPFIDAMNEVFLERGIELPLEDQATTVYEVPDDGEDLRNRRVAGTKASVDLFGDFMREAWRMGPEEKRHINYWLNDNCFGDYYTRNGLPLKEREMITFCFIMAQGGAEPQLQGHTRGNLSAGNDRLFLIQLVSQCLPFIGYPRALNALSVIDEVAKAQ